MLSQEYKLLRTIDFHIKRTPKELRGTAAGNHAGGKYFEIFHQIRNFPIDIEFEDYCPILGVHLQFGFCYGIIDAVMDIESNLFHAPHPRPMDI